MGKGSVHLAYPVRLRVIGKYTGQLCIVLAAVTAVPLMVGIIAGQWGFAWRTALSVAVLGGGGTALNMLSAPGRLQTNEALIVSAAAFLIGALAMVFPLMSFGLAGLDALFEAVSGVTTTGLTTMARVEDKPRVFLFARAWMQWYGGLGVVALSLAFLTRPGIIARRLSMAEPEEEELLASTRAHSRRVIVVYGLLTAGGFLLLLLCGASWFSALAHTLSGVSTGGFSIYDESIGGQSGSIRGGVILVSLTGAISFGRPRIS